MQQWAVPGAGHVPTRHIRPREGTFPPEGWSTVAGAPWGSAGVCAAMAPAAGIVGAVLATWRRAPVGDAWWDRAEVALVVVVALFVLTGVVFLVLRGGPGAVSARTGGRAEPFPWEVGSLAVAFGPVTSTRPTGTGDRGVVGVSLPHPEPAPLLSDRMRGAGLAVALGLAVGGGLLAVRRWVVGRPRSTD